MKLVCRGFEANDECAAMIWKHAVFMTEWEGAQLENEPGYQPVCRGFVCEPVAVDAAPPGCRATDEGQDIGFIQNNGDSDRTSRSNLKLKVHYRGSWPDT